MALVVAMPPATTGRWRPDPRCCAINDSLAAAFLFPLSPRVAGGASARASITSPCKSALIQQRFEGSRSTSPVPASAASPASCEAARAMSYISAKCRRQCGRSGQPRTGIWVCYSLGTLRFFGAGTPVRSVGGGLSRWPLLWPKLGLEKPAAPETAIPHGSPGRLRPLKATCR